MIKTIMKSLTAKRLAAFVIMIAFVTSSLSSATFATMPPLRQDNALVFYRTNSHSDGGLVSVTQDLNSIVEDDSTINVKARIKIIENTLKGSGWWSDERLENEDYEFNANGEYPVHLYVYYTDKQGNERLWTWGFLDTENTNVLENYNIVDKKDWYDFELNLPEEVVSQIQTITKIKVGGNGHDFAGAIDYIKVLINDENIVQNPGFEQGSSQWTKYHETNVKDKIRIEFPNTNALEEIEKEIEDEFEYDIERCLKVNPNGEPVPCEIEIDDPKDDEKEECWGNDPNGNPIGCGEDDEENYCQGSDCEIPKIDLVIVLDSTGSMSDEITMVKAQLKSVIEEIRNGEPSPDLRVGIVVYRDHKPQDKTYVFNTFDLTDDIDEAVDYLLSVKAKGGGDYEEAVGDAIHAALNNMNWRDDAKKLIYLVGDAPPHQDQDELTIYNWEDEALDAKERGIIVYTIGAIGLNERGVELFQSLSDMTGGQFESIEYAVTDAEEYYREKEFTREEITVIESDKTVFDKVSGTLNINNLADSFSAFGMAEAASMGVRYKDEIDTKHIPDDTVVIPVKDHELDEDMWYTPPEHVINSTIENVLEFINSIFENIFSKEIYR